MRLADYELKELFSFDKMSVSHHLYYELKLGYKFEDSFRYIIRHIKPKKVGDLGKMKWSEGKRYDWISVKSDGVTFLIRGYRHHYTIYFMVTDAENDYYNKFGCFTFRTDMDKLSEDVLDSYHEDNYIDINNHLKGLLEFIGKRAAT